jgi:hypothetical protein
MKLWADMCSQFNVWTFMGKYIKIKPIDMKDKSNSVIDPLVFLHSIVVGLTTKPIRMIEQAGVYDLPHALVRVIRTVRQTLSVYVT